jgi:Helicase conserved C-terminal domain
MSRLFGDPTLDRLAALREGGVDAIERLLDAVPILTDVAAGLGPLTRFDARGYQQPKPRSPQNLQDFAAYLATPFTIDIISLSLPVHAYQVFVTLGWLGGSSSIDELKRVAPGAAEGVIDDAIDILTDVLLVERVMTSTIRLRPGVAHQVPFVGHSIAHTTDWIHSEVIAGLLGALHVNVPSTKAARAKALEAALRDPVVVQEALDEVSPAARSIFERLLRYRDAEISLAGLQWFMTHRPDRTTPFYELYHRGLVGVDGDGRQCWVWVEVRAAVQGGLFTSWRTPSPPALQPVIDDDRVGVAAFVKLADRLFQDWRATPLNTLKTGGVGVNVVRATAKKHGVPPGSIGLLLTLAAELDLIHQVVSEIRGRGRNRQEVWVWEPTGAADAYDRLSPGQRHALWVQAWRDSLQLLAGHALPERYDRNGLGVRGLLQRDRFLRYLASLPVGQGVEESALGVALADRLGGSCLPPEVDALVAAARALGLVTTTGPVGLTRTGRRMVAPHVVIEADHPTETSFVVQADHTVMAPPGLRVDIEERLEQIATLESSGAMRVYRITERSVLTAIDAGMTDTTIADFLTMYSSVPVAANVLRTVHDAAARHGRLRVGSCTSWLVTDDPIALASAVAVKAAKLIAVTSTMAISTLSEAELTAVLRAKHLAPVSDAELRARTTRDMSAAHSEVPSGANAGSTAGGQVGDLVVFPQFTLRAKLLTDPGQQSADAHRLFNASPPPVEPAGTRGDLRSVPADGQEFLRMMRDAFEARSGPVPEGYWAAKDQEDDYDDDDDDDFDYDNDMDQPE